MLKAERERIGAALLMDRLPVKIFDVHIRQGGNALDGIQLQIGAGEYACCRAARASCGKTTLLRQLKPAVTPTAAAQPGYLDGAPVEQLSSGIKSTRIGYVMQDPDSDCHGSRCGAPASGRTRGWISRPSGSAAEMAQFFACRRCSTGRWSLSRGHEAAGESGRCDGDADVLEKDEPTLPVDPVSASEFFRSLTDQPGSWELRCSSPSTGWRVFTPPWTGSLCWTGAGWLPAGTPEETARQLMAEGLTWIAAPLLPGTDQLWGYRRRDCPLTVREGRLWLASYGNLLRSGARPRQRSGSPRRIRRSK